MSTAQLNNKGKVERQLSTGHTISLTFQDDKLLRNSFNYLCGFSKRMGMLTSLKQKRLEFSHLKRLSSRRNADENEPQALKEDKDQFIQQLESEIKELTEKLRELESIDKRAEKITPNDLEMALTHYGMQVNPRVIMNMIWEIDENCDELVDWDEYQLTYFRNINDKTRNEPFSFFHVQQYFAWDEQHKGYIIEDDCMEVLFSRLGRYVDSLRMHCIFDM